MNLPTWLKTNTLKGLRPTKQLLRRYGLSTVCEEARCPNKGHCFNRPTATFMILGNDCTRACGFCSVDHSTPMPLSIDEPERVAQAARELNLRHVVITSVTRDDLPDGGAGHFAKTITAVKTLLKEATIEVLTPDFKGNIDDLKTVLTAMPDVFNHNIETVPSLYHIVRPQADYKRSLYILKEARLFSENVNIPKKQIRIKSGLMVGLGETFDEIITVISDLYQSGCELLTIGQYMRPSKKNLPVHEYIHPDVFERYKEKALKIGFSYVASAPLVRSSMNADEML